MIDPEEREEKDRDLLDEQNPEEIPEVAECVAQVISPADHPITLDMIDRDALYILQTLSDAGFSGYLVGGGVRDLYLGKKPKDFDISTDARPGQLRKLFKRSTTIGRRFRLVQVFFGGGKVIEVSTLRSLSEFDLDGPVPVLAPNNTFGTLSEDARRRDLTINSLFYEIQNQTIIDYVHGAEDLKNGIIRIVGDPERRIAYDPVRMMRAIRHAAGNNFTIEENSWQNIVRNADKLKLCPPSRLRDEFLKDLYGGFSTPWFDLSCQSGIYAILFPIYRKLLNQSDEAKQQLHALFETIDRVNRQCIVNGVHRQKDYFLMALTLIPWAENNYQLFSTYRKGANLFKFTNIIREEIDNTIGVGLNLRRSLRQEMTSLLIHLAQMIHNRSKHITDQPAENIEISSWPKWLRRKSYFNKALLFYQFYQESITGKPVVPEQKVQAVESKQETEIAEKIESQPVKDTVVTEEAEKIPEERTSEKDTKNGENSKGRGRVAYAPNTPGGVFGFLR